MFRGILNFFSSGTVLNPMFLLGVGSGAFLSYRFNTDKLYSIFMWYDTYLVAVAIAFVYTFAFNQVFKGYSSTIDWPETFKRFISQSILLIVSAVVSAFVFEQFVF
ncbi:MAG: hypothetical protein J6K16_07950 [Alphaproteobacteria bacterium]|nr:hypothetical protein [Alphaproteobacteria bacterium]